jgi:hypothetical protein
MHVHYDRVSIECKVRKHNREVPGSKTQVRHRAGTTESSIWIVILICREKKTSRQTGFTSQAIGKQFVHDF